MALSLSGPGIFWVNSGVTTPDLLPYNDFVRWYENVHIPDWMGAKNGTISAAWRYQCLDTNRTTPFLVVYKYNDVADLNAPEFRNVPLTHPSLPGGGPITKFTEFRGMAGPYIETWKSSNATGERGPLLISEAINPAENLTDKSFHEWYHQIYIKEVTQMKGWRRTTRFQNTMARNGRGGGSGRWLALHEFEDGAFEGRGKSISSLLGQSKETKQVQDTAKGIDIAPFKLARQYGNTTVPWGDGGGEKIL